MIESLNREAIISELYAIVNAATEEECEMILPILLDRVEKIRQRKELRAAV